MKPKYNVGELVSVNGIDMFYFIVEEIHILKEKIVYTLNNGSTIGEWEEKYIDVIQNQSFNYLKKTEDV